MVVSLAGSKDLFYEADIRIIEKVNMTSYLSNRLRTNMYVFRFVWNFPKAHEISFGLGPNYYFISREQVKLGLDVHVITRRKINDLAYEEVDGIKVHRVKFPYNVNAVKKVEELKDQLVTAVVHAHGTCGFLYPLFRRRIGIPLVAHVHGITLGMKRHAYRLPVELSLRLFLKSRYREELSIMRQRLFWRFADTLITCSKAQKMELNELYGIKSDKVCTVYNGVDPSIFKPSKNTYPLKKRLGLENKRVILFVGHFVLRKGIPYLLEAMPRILSEVPNAFLLCVGGTPDWLGTRLYWKYLQDDIAKKELGTHVKLLGQIPHHDLPHYYSMSDVFAFPSLYEAFAKVPLEAMACEKPVVISRVGGLPEAIEHNINGILVAPKNADQLADAIIMILQDKKLAQRMGRKGRETVINQFTWQHTAEEILAVYQRLLQSN